VKCFLRVRAHEELAAVFVLFLSLAAQELFQSPAPPSSFSISHFLCGHRSTAGCLNAIQAMPVPFDALRLLMAFGEFNNAHVSD